MHCSWGQHLSEIRFVIIMGTRLSYVLGRLRVGIARCNGLNHSALAKSRKATTYGRM